MKRSPAWNRSRDALRTPARGHKTLQRIGTLDALLTSYRLRMVSPSSDSFLPQDGLHTNGALSDCDGDCDWGDPTSTCLEDLVNCRKLHFDLPADTWGVTIVVVVKDFADMWAGNVSYTRVLRFSFSIFVLVLNLVLQLMLLHWVQVFVVQSGVHTVQSHYGSYRAQVMTPTGVNMTAWQNFGARDELCQAALTRRDFLSAILFLWALRMLQELRETNRMRRHIFDLPALPEDAGVEDMVYESMDENSADETGEIIALNLSTRLVLLGVVILPKFIICFYLLWLGSKWLTSTESFGDLILNALALEFIIAIDELLFSCMFPEPMVLMIDRMKFAIPDKLEDLPASTEIQEKEVAASFHRSIVFVLIAFCWVVLYIFWLQQVLPGYNGDLGLECPAYIEQRFKSRCGFLSNDCFPIGIDRHMVQPVMSTHHSGSPGGTRHR